MVSARQRDARKQFRRVKGLAPVATVQQKKAAAKDGDGGGGGGGGTGGGTGAGEIPKMSLKQRLKRKKLDKLKRKEKLKKEKLARKKLGIEEKPAGKRKNGTSNNNNNNNEKGGGEEKKRRKHPLREAAAKYGATHCFQCGGADHVRRDCPENAKSAVEKICLLCREKGHTIKYCRKAVEDGGDGGVSAKLCYNCGEHSHRLADCKQPIKEGGALDFAICFICNAAGHLSSNCPSNEHGVYPKGGSCKRCGSVAHLAKDCPTQPVKLAQGMKITTEGKWALAQNKVTKLGGDDLDDDFAPVVDDDKAFTAAEAEHDEDLDVDARLGGEGEEGMLHGKRKGKKKKKKNESHGSDSDGDDEVSRLEKSSKKRKVKTPRVVKF